MEDLETDAIKVTLLQKVLKKLIMRYQQTQVKALNFLKDEKKNSIALRYNPNLHKDLNYVLKTFMLNFDHPTFEKENR